MASFVHQLAARWVGGGSVVGTVLEPKERQVLELRYGLRDGRPRDLIDTRAVLHLTSASEYLIELQALRKLAEARVISDEMRDAWGEVERTSWPSAV